MHVEALGFVERTVDNRHFDRVLEIGARDVNGSPRRCFPGSAYYGIDLVAGPGVDHVADAATWRSRRRFDAVVCCEVLEHTPLWRDLIATGLHHLRKGGLFVVTCAGPGREPHSAVDGGALRDGEWYQNVTPDELEAQLALFSAAGVGHHEDRGDLYGWALK